MNRRGFLKNAAATGVATVSAKAAAERKKEDDGRRVRILSISPKMMVDLMNWWIQPPDFLALPVTEEIPEGVRVVSVNSNWHTNCVELMIAHESFDVVPCGEQPPRVTSRVTEWRHVPFSELRKRAHG